MTPGAHDDMQLLLPALAFGSIAEDEREDVERHLTSCESCRETLAMLELTGSQLLDAVPLVEPPASLRDQILARPEIADAGRAATVSTSTIEEPVAAATASLDDHRSARQPRARRWFVPASRSMLQPTLVAACALLVLVSVGLVTQVRDLQGQRSDLRAAAQDSRKEASSLRAERSTPIVALHSARVNTTGILQQTTADVAVIGDRSAIIVLRGLPKPGEGRSWQAWAQVARGKMRSIRVLDTGGPLAIMPVHLPAGATAVAFTLEPSGGSAQPTTSPVAFGALT